MQEQETESAEIQLEADKLEDLPVDNDTDIVGGGMLNNKHPELTR